MGDKPIETKSLGEFDEIFIFRPLITHHFTLLLLMAAMLGILIVEIAAGNKK
ncbi:MAG: hypothetical protein CM15mP42_09930 [Methanobacteriota archaeon]|nr:MAG: hypothetical protein CM15mP42_09930 [Euryarchaeota archaeon]